MAEPPSRSPSPTCRRSQARSRSPLSPPRRGDRRDTGGKGYGGHGRKGSNGGGKGKSARAMGKGGQNDLEVVRRVAQPRHLGRTQRPGSRIFAARLLSPWARLARPLSFAKPCTRPVAARSVCRHQRRSALQPRAPGGSAPGP